MNLTINSMLDLTKTKTAPLFQGKTNPWEVLPLIGDYVYELAKTLGPEYKKVEGKDIWIGEGTTIDECVLIKEPTIIGCRCEIRHGAYIRGKVILGDEVVLGNSCEVKNAIVFDQAQIPHFNYVGDSVLGYKAHIGAGVKLSNVKSDKSLVTLINDDERIETGLKKFGAIIGDHVEVGCNAVLNPGTVLGRESTVYPLTFVRGIIPQKHIVKQNGSIIKKR
jgi:NDP-sugar pyrophosphorylase family protein